MRVRLELEVVGFDAKQRRYIYSLNNDCFLARAIKKVLREDLGVSVGGTGKFFVRSTPNHIWANAGHRGEILYTNSAKRWGGKVFDAHTVASAKKNPIVYANIPKKFLKPTA